MTALQKKTRLISSQMAAVVGRLFWLVLLLSLPLRAWSAEDIGIELNKLEQKDEACLVYLVLQNRTEDRFDDLKLDLVLFDRDGLILRRLALNVGPLADRKTSVKLFEINDNACATVGRLLVNEVLSCETANGPAEGCMQRLTLSSRNDVTLFK